MQAYHAQFLAFKLIWHAFYRKTSTVYALWVVYRDGGILFNRRFIAQAVLYRRIDLATAAPWRKAASDKGCRVDATENFADAPTDNAAVIRQIEAFNGFAVDAEHLALLVEYKQQIAAAVQKCLHGMIAGCQSDLLIQLGFV